MCFDESKEQQQADSGMGLNSPVPAIDPLKDKPTLHQLDSSPGIPPAGCHRRFTWAVPWVSACLCSTWGMVGWLGSCVECCGNRTWSAHAYPLWQVVKNQSSPLIHLLIPLKTSQQAVCTGICHALVPNADHSITTYESFTQRKERN